MVTRSEVVFLYTTSCIAWPRAAHSGSQASWLLPISTLAPTQVRFHFHTIEYQVAPSSSRKASVNMASPSRVQSASAFASASSSCSSSELRVSSSSSRTVLSVGPLYTRVFVSHLLIPVGAPPKSGPPKVDSVSVARCATVCSAAVQLLL